MGQTFSLDVLSIEEVLYSGDARFVIVPGQAGELGIYPLHTPLFTTIKAGVVTITRPQTDTPHRLLVAGGVLEIAREGVVLVVDHALRSAELDAARAEAARHAADEWRARYAGQTRRRTFDVAAAKTELMDEIRRFFALAMHQHGRRKDSGTAA